MEGSQGQGQLSGGNMILQVGLEFMRTTLTRSPSSTASRWTTIPKGKFWVGRRALWDTRWIQLNKRENAIWTCSGRGKGNQSDQSPAILNSLKNAKNQVDPHPVTCGCVIKSSIDMRGFAASKNWFDHCRWMTSRSTGSCSRARQPWRSASGRARGRSGTRPSGGYCGSDSGTSGEDSAQTSYRCRTCNPLVKIRSLRLRD